jgi:hypothetical protein
VTHSLYLLAAAWLAGAGGEAAVSAGPVSVEGQPVFVVPATTASYPVYSYSMPQEPPGFFGRLRNRIHGLFGQRPGCAPRYPQQYQVMPQAMPSAEPPLADRVPAKPSTYPVVPVLQAKTPPPPPPDAEPGAEEAQEPPTADQEINTRYIDKIGHEDDYSWVTGQLYQARISGTLVWVVRYATIDTEDRFGGSVVLAPAVNMKNFREGDLVSVKGEIINEGRANKYLGGPLYRVLSIDMIERAD